MPDTHAGGAQPPEAGAGEPPWPEGCRIEFPAGSVDYVAGHPDRFLFGRSFQPVFVFRDLGATAKAATVIAKSTPTSTAKSPAKSGGKSAGDAAAKYLDQVEQTVLRVFGKQGEGLASTARLMKMLQAEDILAAKPSVPGYAPDAKLPDKTPPFIKSPLPVQDLIGKVGVLFYDRLRFRNIGTAVGEHITTLALAPGEEVSFTQRSETVRRVSVEEEVTRETEREYRLSSTWSTDWGAQAAHTTNFNIGGSLGANAGIKIPEVDFLTLGGQGGGDVSYAETHTRGTQLNYTYQLVQDIGRRMREEHRTHVSVSREQIDSFETARRVVNQNPLRALMLRFFKLYNKERVTLERYDAKLAMNVCLVNPLMGLFQALDAELDRLDPNNPANYNCTPPAAPAALTRYITINYEDPNDIISYTAYYHLGWVTANPNDSNLVFSHYDAPELIEWDIKENDTGATRAADVSQYYEYGGSLEHGVSGPPEMLIPATRDVWIKAWSAKSFLGGPMTPGSWWTKRLRFRVRQYFVPKLTDNVAYQQCVEAERLRLLQALSAERLDALIVAALRPMEEHIFRKVIQSTFMPHFAALGDQLADYLIKEFRHLFEWNEAVVQSMPSWLTGQEDSYYQYVRTRLSAILPGYDPGRVLPRHLFASGVQVILPVRPGSEEEVFALLTDETITVDTFLKKFREFRAAHYGDIERPLPSFEDVLAARCDVGTPDCADDWGNEWERPRRRFDVLGAWAEYTPTDGVHLEPRLSACAGADEGQLDSLRTQSEYRLAVRDLTLGKAAPPASAGEGE